MPVNRYKLDKALQRYEKATHVIAKGPLVKRDLTNLQKYSEEQVLTLRSVRSDTLEFVSAWLDLRDIRLYSCKIGDWSQLIKCKKLERVFINGIRHRTPDISFFSQLTQVKELSLGYAPYLTELPDMSRCKRLKRLYIFNCRWLRDLSPILRIPNLESFHIVVTPHQPNDLEAIMAMPKMKFMTGAFGSKKRDDLFRELLGKYGLLYGG